LYVRDVCPIVFATKAEREETERMERARSEELDKGGAGGSLLPSLSWSDGLTAQSQKKPKKNRNKNVKSKLRKLRATASVGEFFRLSEEEAMSDESARKWRASRRGEVWAWSRIHYNVEVLVVLNTHPTEERRALVTVDRHLQKRKHVAKLKASITAAGPSGDQEPLEVMTMLYHSEWSDARLGAVIASEPGKDTSEDCVQLCQQKDGRHFVSITLPAAGMAILH
jgi:hypothetical protein